MTILRLMKMEMSDRQSVVWTVVTGLASTRSGVSAFRRIAIATMCRIRKNARTTAPRHSFETNGFEVNGFDVTGCDVMGASRGGT
ncbi:hypothetical protein [Bradyrhizobium sp. HKCCYLR20261]|uniref:hypothetical protein n=1 Tax=Bradyrhizobium sp. HKCCYLR20261 TaxID=3420760 RepID=UPI003EBDF9F6